MIIMTFQHRSVLEEIKTRGKYFCNVDSEFKKNSPNLYKYLQQFIFDRTGIDSNPVFGWSNLISNKEEEDLSHRRLDLLNPSKETILSSLNKVPFKCKDYLILVLDVPSELVVTHDFYSFASFKLDEYEDLCDGDDLKDFIYNSGYDYESDLQSCFPFIDKSFIKKVYSFTETLENGYKTIDLDFKEMEWSNDLFKPSSIF